VAQDKIAGRYAKAIMDLPLKGGELEKIADELAGFASLVEGHEDLKAVFTSEAFSTEKRIAVLEGLTSKLGLSKYGARVLVYLCSVNRLRQLAPIAENLQLQILKSKDVVPLSVESREPLGKTDKDLVTNRFRKLFGKEVSATFAVDEDLIGGLRVTAEGRTYDGTLSTRLATMREQLVGGN
jgi:F-type H+-transporting ATPase subunit delta